MPEQGELFSITPASRGFIVAGEIDGNTSPVLAAALLGKSADAIELDMAGIEFVDSSGLRVLIEAHQKAQAAGGSLTLISISETVARLLEISGVDTYLDVQH
jgi:anti-sigma B factor antagonist